jgi:hypothetical protein
VVWARPVDRSYRADVTAPAVRKRQNRRGWISDGHFHPSAHLAEVAEPERVALAESPVRRRGASLTPVAERGTGTGVTPRASTEFPHGPQTRAAPLPPLPGEAAATDPPELGAPQPNGQLAVVQVRKLSLCERLVSRVLSRAHALTVRRGDCHYYPPKAN